jgi:tetratricopeptide (TPR) repeat protein
MAVIQLCVSQEPDSAPYVFKTTGVRVYSFEEVLYHVFHNWRESADEFLCDTLIVWVTELGHSYLAARMKELSQKENFAEKVMGFLRLISYFDDDDLSVLQAALEKWEQRRGWEQLKERADYFAGKNECEKAIPLYKRALQYEENAAVLNNLAVQYMQTSAAQEGLSCLTRALSLEPANFSILLHYIEAAILNADYDKAAKAIKRAYEIDPNHADIAFLLGLMSYHQKDYPTALKYFEKAMQTDKTVPFYAYKTADIHVQMRRYEKALAALQQIAVRDTAYYAKEAEIYAAWGDVSRAITSLNFALRTGEPQAALYAKLAAYHRQEYAIERAEFAIKKALELSPDNNIVQLENARIKKGLGRTREYQAALNEILKSFKDSYRVAQ